MCIHLRPRLLLPSFEQGTPGQLDSSQQSRSATEVFNGTTLVNFHGFRSYYSLTLTSHYLEWIIGDLNTIEVSVEGKPFFFCWHVSKDLAGWLLMCSHLEMLGFIWLDRWLLVMHYESVLFVLAFVLVFWTFVFVYLYIWIHLVGWLVANYAPPIRPICLVTALQAREQPSISISDHFHFHLTKTSST